MARHHGIVRRASITLFGALALLALTGPAAQAGGDPAPCRVRNVTQDTVGHKFKPMVEAAVDGDRLRVRGTCTGGVVIDRDIAIRGAEAGAVITGRGDIRKVLGVKRWATVTLRHLTIQRGRHGGIYNRGTLTLIGASVRHNGTAGIGEPSIDEERSCGGICGSGTLTLVDSVVRANTGSYSGGIYIGGDVASPAVLTLVRTTVSGNKNRLGDGGGGIHSNGHSTVRLIDSVVGRNTAGGNGGGIYVEIGTLTLTGSVVADNTAEGFGGGIYTFSPQNVTLTDSVVADNTAERGGGGIVSANVMTLTGSTVSGNVAGADGGGIVSLGPLTLTGSTVSGNTAKSGHGGGIYNAYGTLTLTGSTVSGNTAKSRAGGGIYNDSGTLTLVGSVVRRNKAGTQGGGIFIHSGSGTVIIDAASSVKDNVPDDCVGTTAC